MVFKRIKENLANVFGWNTNMKLIIFESDDWGGIRMPSKEVFNSLTIKGIKVDDDDHWSLDCLESGDDLQNLFSILEKYQDQTNNHPRFTSNMVMGNPDFEEIKNSNFNLFFHEHFFDSYKKYHGSDLTQIWKRGIEGGLVHPQFHAKEHVNISLWLKDLREDIKETRIAFDHGFFGLVTRTSSPNQKHYLAAYRAESQAELLYINNAALTGLDMFEKTFGFKSESFISCNYVWPQELEPNLKMGGIQFLQAQRGQVQPDPFNKGKIKIRRHYMGEKNSLGQIYTIRNVKFEPFENPNSDWVDTSLEQIRSAFFWNKPAIISTHRINYVGGIDIKHRDRNLKALDNLMKKILKKWPDVIFLSSDQLGRLINLNINS